MVRLEDISAYYGAKKVVDGASFDAKAGEVVTIVGRNGSGKSTLLKAIAGDVKVEGRVVVDGELDLWDMTRRDRALKVAFVEQTLPDVEMTVEDYVALGRMPHSGLFGLGIDNKDKTVVERVLREVGIEKLRTRIVNELSGGERQMCAISRALAQETDIVLMDEPTASLDLANQMMVMGLIGEMKKSGKTVICVMHDMNMAMDSGDRMVVMKEGRILSVGRVGEEVTEAVLEDAMGVRIEIIEVKERNKRIIVSRK